jgi:WD40 repeat protein
VNTGPEAVSALAFSPDGRTVAAAGDSGSLSLCDTSSQQPLGSGLTAPGDAIGGLAFTPDGATLHTTSPHAPLQRYPVTPSYVATRICARTGTTLLVPRRLPGEPLSSY